MGFATRLCVLILCASLVVLCGPVWSCVVPCKPHTTLMLSFIPLWHKSCATQDHMRPPKWHQCGTILALQVACRVVMRVTHDPMRVTHVVWHEFCLSGPRGDPCGRVIIIIHTQDHMRSNLDLLVKRRGRIICKTECI